MSVNTRLVLFGSTLLGGLLMGPVLSAQEPEVPVLLMSDAATATDGAAYDVLGTAIALQEDTLFVGARGADAIDTNGGAVYLFQADEDGWTQVQKLTGSDTMANDEFGSALDVSGVRMAVGVPRYDVDDESDAGRVVLFTFNGASWIESAVILPPTPQVDAGFGRTTALDDRTLAVGAPGHDAAVRNEGEVHLYSFDDKTVTWSLDTTLVAPDSGENDRFGASLDLVGDLLVVGVEADDDAGIDAGAAWVFRRIDGIWTPETKLTGTDGEWFARFACSVAINEDGTTIAVGAERSDLFGVDDGAVMLWTLDAASGDWERGPVLGAAGAASARELGRSLAFDGDRLVVGMPVADDPAADAGAAMLYTRLDAETWVADVVLQPVLAGELELCGYSVAASSGRIAVGRPLSGGNGTWLGDVLVVDLTADCNENDVPDPIELAYGSAVDTNGNGILDTCECFGDLNIDGRTDGADLSILLGYWGSFPENLPEADINGDGIVSGSDLSILLGYWGPCS